ncbi:MAG TPA: aspartate kinase [Candidatus Avirikenella pullistercoris]|nr:aspartate kinase [Candidatus Avirikenella pullistercoris]
MSKVLKFGGTSVGSETNMRKVAEIIRHEQAKVTVLSAMSGTTDSLVKISSDAKNGKNCSATILLLKNKYDTCIQNLLSQYKEEALKKAEEVFSSIKTKVHNYKGISTEREILAQGELLTSAIFTFFLKESGLKAVLLNIPDYMHLNEEHTVNTDYLEKSIRPIIETSDDDTYFVTQGFICKNANGELDNLGRGGSDYSAALIGAAINASEVQIWTDIDGMHNNDPRYVENTYPIHKMSFDEAAELAYFGAKILHPATIQPCKEHGIAVRLKNTMAPQAEGTLITNSGDSEKKFHAVAAKDNITVIRICSARMLMAYGFLRKVFEIFENYKTPIDMITTSEVAVSLTIDNDEHLSEIVEELKTLGNIEIEKGNTIICVVGKLDHSKSGLVARILESINNIPIKMISYGASNRNVTFLISSENKKEALQFLNNHLF